MKEIDKNELASIVGGSSIAFTAGMVTAIATSCKILLEMGRATGSAVRRFKSQMLCDV